jgi:hypothetical protein
MMYPSYYPPQMGYSAGYPTHRAVHDVAPVAPRTPTRLSLEIRQQPKEALLAVRGKEKFRKPVDPPPIVFLKVTPDGDPNLQYLQNPYIFVSASLYKADKDEPIDSSPNDSLTGTLVSSLHRLKDVDNKDGGFFVFGDISIKLAGVFRLHFTLYEFQPDSNQFVYLSSQTSDRFSVVLPKDFKGLEESTYLSRAFSDQGVRLRIRKESRGMSAKRTYEEPTSSNPNAPIAPNVGDYQESKKPRHDNYIDSPVISRSAPHMNLPSTYMPPSTQQHALRDWTPQFFMTQHQHQQQQHTYASSYPSLPPTWPSHSSYNVEEETYREP